MIMNYVPELDCILITWSGKIVCFCRLVFCSAFNFTVFSVRKSIAKTRKKKKKKKERKREKEGHLGVVISQAQVLAAFNPEARSFMYYNMLTYIML